MLVAERKLFNDVVKVGYVHLSTHPGIHEYHHGQSICGTRVSQSNNTRALGYTRVSPPPTSKCGTRVYPGVVILELLGIREYHGYTRVSPPTTSKCGTREYLGVVILEHLGIHEYHGCTRVSRVYIATIMKKVNMSRRRIVGLFSVRSQ